MRIRMPDVPLYVKNDAIKRLYWKYREIKSSEVNRSGQRERTNNPDTRGA